MKFELIKDVSYITPEDKIRWARKDPDTYIGWDIGNGKILCKRISECTDDEILSAEPFVFLTESEMNRGANNDRPSPQGNRNNPRST